MAKPKTKPETHAKPLLRLANSRVSRAIKAINMIGNLSAYNPDQSQIEQMMTAIEAAKKDAFAKLQRKNVFQLAS